MALNRLPAIIYDKFTDNIEGFPKLGYFWFSEEFLRNVNYYQNLEIKKYPCRRILKKRWETISTHKFNSSIYYGMISGFNQDDIEFFNKGFTGTSLIFRVNYIILKLLLRGTEIKFPGNWILSHRSFLKIHKFLKTNEIPSLDDCLTEYQINFKEKVKYIEEFTYHYNYIKEDISML